MRTIELVDPELRDALALSPQVPLTAETLTRRRADALALLSSVPTPDLPDLATGEIHVESAFGAKRTLDVDLARGEVGQVRCRNGAQQRERIGATPRQGFGGQRHLWPQRERIAQFRVDKFDCAHGRQPGPFGAEQNGIAATARRQVSVDFGYR